MIYRSDPPTRVVTMKSTIKNITKLETSTLVTEKILFLVCSKLFANKLVSFLETGAFSAS